MIQSISIFVTLIFEMALSKQHPNILLILMDDLGYTDVGYYGGNIPTPNIDQMAADGIRLNYHYAENLCSITRSALLSGRYPWRTGLNEILALPNNMSVDRSFDLISDSLIINGYDTLFTGKWHIGSSDLSVVPHGRGFAHSPLYFTQAVIRHDQHVSCTPFGYAAYEGFASTELAPSTFGQTVGTWGPLWCLYDLWYDNHESYLPYDTNQYADRLFADTVLDYLDDFSEDPEHDPFFIYWAIHTPHTPYISPPQTTTECDSLVGTDRQIICQMIHYADSLIGEVITKLQTLEIYQDTVILFLSDNGGQAYTQAFGEGAGQNLPFRGTKGTTFEGGIRTPAIITGGVIKEKYYGCNYNNLVHIVDWYKIVLQFAGIKNKDVPQFEDLDGVNLWPNIKEVCQPPDSSDSEDENNNGYGRFGVEKGSVQRDILVTFRSYGNGDIARAAVFKDGYKLVINPNSVEIQDLQSLTIGWDEWVNYNGTTYHEPVQSYYEFFDDFDQNNDDQNLFYSKCYEDYLEDDILNSIYTDPYILDGNELYLYYLKEDNIEACNIASFQPDIVTDLLDLLYSWVPFAVDSTYITNAEKGAYQAIADTYDCDKELFVETVWNDNPIYHDIESSWNDVFLSIANAAEKCSAPFLSTTP